MAPADNPLSTIERLLHATNAHDIEQLVACFADDYRLEAPLHPERSFEGNAQVRRNWTQIFAAIPDLSARLVGSAVAESTVWSEWEMSGTRRDGQAHLMRGVFIFGVATGLVRWGRMFLEPVEHASAGMDAALRTQLASQS